MKIIENKLNKDTIEWPVTIECGWCDSKLQVDEEDCHVGSFGMKYCTCPVCGKETIVDDNESFVITKDNVIFPDHFFGFQNGVDISPEEIKTCIDRGITYIRNHPETGVWYTAFGNMFIFVQNLYGDNEYYIMVTKDYYDINIPYEDADYLAQSSVHESLKDKYIIVRSVERKE